MQKLILDLKVRMIDTGIMTSRKLKIINIYIKKGGGGNFSYKLTDDCLEKTNKAF